MEKVRNPSGKPGWGTKRTNKISQRDPNQEVKPTRDLWGARVDFGFCIFGLSILDFLFYYGFWIFGFWKLSFLFVDFSFVFVCLICVVWDVEFCMFGFCFLGFGIWILYFWMSGCGLCI